MGRRKARETSLQMLFQRDVGDNDWDMTILTLDEAELSGENAEFVVSLIKGVEENLEVIDQKIQKYARGWDINRFTNIDKSILRLGIYELFFCKEISANIVINEAVELAKKFSDDQSAKFVNGILDSIYVHEIKPPDTDTEDSEV